jgi:TRAP transporter TAXI family solute receptor
MKTKTKRLVGLLVLVSTLLLTTACSMGIANGSKRTFISVATASTGGTYYPIGVGLGNVWTELLYDEGIKANGQSSAGSIENIHLLNNDEAQVAILQGLITSQAYEGQGAFEGKPYKDLRTISMLWPNVEHFVLMNNKKDTGTISDIEGHSFSVGPQASGTEASTLVMMEGLGLTKKNITPEYLGYDDTISAICMQVT